MPLSKTYIEAMDNASDYAEARVDALSQSALEDMDDLITSEANRDDELWAEFGVNGELVLSDYEEVERDERDLTWTLGLAGISAASLYQFTLDNREETIIKPAAYKIQVVGTIASQMTRAQLITAGKRGFAIEGVKGFAPIQTVHLDKLKALRTATNVELYNGLTEIGAMRPIEKAIADSTKYVSRMTSHAPGTPQFKEEVASMIDVNSRRGLSGMNRRAVQQVYTTEQIGGDMERLMVWVVEGGKGTCGRCIGRAGDMQTYAEWVADGLPGADVCEGGDL